MLIYVFLSNHILVFPILNGHYIHTLNFKISSKISLSLTMICQNLESSANVPMHFGVCPLVMSLMYNTAQVQGSFEMHLMCALNSSKTHLDCGGWDASRMCSGYSNKGMVIIYTLLGQICQMSSRHISDVMKACHDCNQDTSQAHLNTTL